MATIYSGRFLVSCDTPLIDRGAILVDETGIIAARGSLTQLRKDYPAATLVTDEQSLLLPLLVNAHTHLELTDYPLWSADLAAPEGFVDWILTLIKAKKKLTTSDYQRSLAHGIEQSLAAGCGAVGDILAHYPARSSYADSPLLGRLYFESLGQRPELICQAQQRLEEVLDSEPVGAIESALSPHSPYTISGDYLERLYRLSRSRGLYCSTHLAESAAEVEFVEQGRGPLATGFYPSVGWQEYLPHTSGLRPLAWLAERGGLFPENLLVHGVHLQQDEIDLLACKGMALALCPRSNAKLKVGKAPAAQLLKAGVRLALGTDSLASSDSLSLWDEMAFAAGWFAGELDAPTLFAMATLGGADALGLSSQLGSLTPGKRASFQWLKAPEGLAQGDVFDYLVSPGRTAAIGRIVHNGSRWLPQTAEQG